MTRNPDRAHSSAAAAPTIPAPIMATSKVMKVWRVWRVPSRQVRNLRSESLSSGGLARLARLARLNSPAEGVAIIEQEGRFGVDEGRALDNRVDGVAGDADLAFEEAADDALLPPDLAFLQFAAGVEAGELGACAGAARRAVVGFAGTEDEVLAVYALLLRGGEQLDVVDLVPTLARDALRGKRLPDSPVKSVSSSRRESETC